MDVQEHMLNTHGTVHEAVMFAIADYVSAAASNSYGKTSVTMNFMAAAIKGELLQAEAREEKRTHKLAWYRIHVKSDDHVVAVMDTTTTVYRKNDCFVPIDELEKGAQPLRNESGSFFPLQ